MEEEDLQRIGDMIEPTVFDTEALLCDAPRDPCVALSLLVIGGVDLVRHSPTGEPLTVEKIARGGMLGDIEVLPPPPAGSAEGILVARQGSVGRARATDFTLTLTLTRTRLEEFMEERPRVKVSAAAASARQASKAMKIQHRTLSCSRLLGMLSHSNHGLIRSPCTLPARPPQRPPSSAPAFSPPPRPDID